jgi:hypothetical protein
MYHVLIRIVNTSENPYRRTQKILYFILGYRKSYANILYTERLMKVKKLSLCIEHQRYKFL